jgi:hypothetical protein
VDISVRSKEFRRVQAIRGRDSSAACRAGHGTSTSRPRSGREVHNRDRHATPAHSSPPSWLGTSRGDVGNSDQPDDSSGSAALECSAVTDRSTPRQPNQSARRRGRRGHALHLPDRGRRPNRHLDTHLRPLASHKRESEVEHRQQVCEDARLGRTGETRGHSGLRREPLGEGDISGQEGERRRAGAWSGRHRHPTCGTAAESTESTTPEYAGRAEDDTNSITAGIRIPT